MSVESEILRIQRNVADTYAAVAEKGGTVPLQPNSENLPAAVSSIPAGGSLVIQEYDTEDGWHVRKFSDGYMEQTLKKELSDVIINTEWGFGYNNGMSYGPFQYPEAFAELYGVSISGAGPQSTIVYSYCDANKALHLTKTPGIALFRPTPVTVGMDFYIWVTARGRWK